MGKRGIELRGIDGFVSELREKFGRASDRVESRILREAAQPMAEAMSDRIDRSDYDYAYHLKDNIKVSHVQRREGVKYVLVGPDKKVSWRARFPEFGTSKMTARPFVEPGYRQEKDATLQRIAEGVRKELRR